MFYFFFFYFQKNLLFCILRLQYYILNNFVKRRSSYNLRLIYKTKTKDTTKEYKKNTQYDYSLGIDAYMVLLTYKLHTPNMIANNILSNSSYHTPQLHFS